VICAGDVFYVSLCGCKSVCHVLTSSTDPDGIVVFIIESDLEDPQVATVSELESIVFSASCCDAWTKQERLPREDLRKLQDAALQSGMAKYYKNLIRDHLCLPRM
jgi:hypothetical protein